MMELYAVLAILVVIVSAYLLRQFWSGTLEIEDTPSGETSPPEAPGAAREQLKAA